MALNMRALYYVVIPGGKPESVEQRRYDDGVKANENNLNQNFLILAQKIEELETRIAVLEADT